MHAEDQAAQVDAFGDYMMQMWRGLKSTGWHWFGYHFSNGPTPFGMAIVRSCMAIDRAAPRIGTTLFGELLSIGGRDRYEPHYEQLLQKMSEILVIERIVTANWPEGTTFEQEPQVRRGGKRPELLVTTEADRFVIEVKTPSQLTHIRNRATNPNQLSYRSVVGRRTAETLLDGETTLPRDNQILGFLKDADAKFADFHDGLTTSMLVIVWDDFIYEPISVLMNAESGLLTANTYAKDGSGEPLAFPNVDAVVALRHLNYFISGSREEPLIDRTNAMDFGDDRAMPNVIFPVLNQGPMMARVVERLRAYPYGDPVLVGAEYQVSDMVFWL
ncbi:hypothetical protein RDV64_08345 [Acuticoccus sp. MNP-M23]|uniref:hypothetical protein n=1 Tax=Acuticoccus sp. MNP-M23 TaxID=3072793 RepID=UPI002816037C|nr:hypothetical protein [Acuticoccus sp. MNP-M23]WMS44385.1 hypothetical protein RDV64_08345 [Acuticoccus sp. MNP-M23]